MTQEEKQLLLKDFCARLPYGVWVNFRGNIEVLHEVHIYQSVQTVVGISGNLYDVDMPNIKPYLRPMSSMTEEEINEFILISDTTLWLGNKRSTCILSLEQMDWLDKKMFDYRGLIPMDLALEAPEGMYKIG